MSDKDLYRRVAVLADQALHAEHVRADTLGTRGTALSGLIGVVLAVTTALSAQSPQTGSVGRPLLAALFVVTVVLLVAAATMAVYTVAPTLRPILNPKVMRRYLELRPSLVELDDHYARRTIELVEQNSDLNMQRSKRLTWSFRLLLAGLTATALQAIIVAVGRLAQL